MGFPYKKVLVVGATSGIGWALAERMIENGVKVVVVGRREERLEQFIQKHGKKKASPVVFDITNLSGIPTFTANIIKEHPDLDCIFLNAGIQRSFNFAKPETIDFNVMNEEFTTNYLSMLQLTTTFLPFLQGKTEQTSIIYTTSGLALVPIPRCPNYSATKAALHQIILCIRSQVKLGPGSVKIIELVPPAVQTELHDEKHQPDIKQGALIGMPIDEFTNEAWEGLEQGDEQIWVGEMTKKNGLGWEQQRQAVFNMIVERMRAAGLG